jgi:rfaE bifunctional protein kinase chain/domain
MHREDRTVKTGENMTVSEALADRVAGLSGRRILVLGDLILDIYLEGSVERVSPEAPVPVVALGRDPETRLPGGAANVAMNILSLGSTPVVAGLVGDDEPGRILTGLLERAGADVSGIVTDPSRPTTVKTRIMARHQQILRLDRESTHQAGTETRAALGRSALHSIAGIDAVLFEDYDKGCIDHVLIGSLVEAGRRAGIPITVDPKFRNFPAYRNCTLFKPNRLEASRNTGIEIHGPQEAREAAGVIRERLQAEAVLITLGEQGSILCPAGREPVYMPTAARRVFDVSGAGDTVIAVATLGLAGGMGMEDSALLANYAAAAVCAEPGVYAVRQSDILREIGSDA